MWLMHMCDMSPSDVWHRSFIFVKCVTLLIYTCNTSLSDVWHDSIKCVTQWRNQLFRIFGPELIRITELLKTVRSTVLKNRVGRSIIFATLAAKFWKHHISSASQRAFPGVLGDFFGCSTPSKEVFNYTRIHSLHVNGIVTASSHALWHVLSNKAIWFLGHCWLDTTHIHIFEGDSVLSKFFAPHAE